MRLRVPYYRQITNVHCGPAVARMVLSYYGIPSPNQERLGKIMDTDLVGENGTRHRELADYLRTKGLVARVTKNSSLKDIQEALSSGFPVIVHYLEPDENDDHYSVVIGISKTHITLNDPWNGKDLTYTHKEFLKRWRDKVGKFNRWMLVPYLLTEAS